MIRVLCLLLLWAGTQGQGISQDNVLVVRANGGVTYYPAEGNPYTVYSGTYLPISGQIATAAGAGAELVYRERYQRLERAGRVGLRDLFSGEDERPGFISRFVSFISNSMEESESAESLEKAYERNQGNAQGNTRGMADTGLDGVRPFGGKLTPGPRRFSWSAYPGAGHYEFSLIDGESGDFIATILTDSARLTLDPADLRLREGTDVIWTARAITSGGTPRRGSLGTAARAPEVELNRITMTYVTTDALLTSPLDTTYALGPLLRLQDLEAAGFLMDADDLYRDLLRDRPGDPVLRRAYAAFLARWNLRQEARQYAK